MLHQHTVFDTKTKAEETAAQNTKTDDDDWGYKVEVDPSGSGRACIKIYDNRGVFLGYL